MNYDKQMELAKWMAKGYFCVMGHDCIRLMQTPGTNSKKHKNKSNSRQKNKCYIPKKKDSGWKLILHRN